MKWLKQLLTRNKPPQSAPPTEEDKDGYIVFLEEEHEQLHAGLVELARAAGIAAAENSKTQQNYQSLVAAMMLKYGDPLEISNEVLQQVFREQLTFDIHKNEKGMTLVLKEPVRESKK